jgi:FtsZ-interacting cell division protein ZipA
VHLPEKKPSLVHMVPGYDPAKAHDYYLRTRKLHPRKKGAAQPTTGRTTGARMLRPVAARPTNNAALRKQRADAAAQVASLQKKLSQLHEALKAALAKEAAAKKSSAKPTAADKSKKARESKKYRQEHKQQLKTKAKQDAAKSGGSSKGKGTATTSSKKSGAGSSKSIRAAIAGVQRALAAAKARQRVLG